MSERDEELWEGACWFIERTQYSTLYNAHFPGSVNKTMTGGRWYAGWEGDGTGYFTDDPERAVRFLRRHDAEAVIRAEYPEAKLIATEHLFLAAAAAPAGEET